METNIIIEFLIEKVIEQSGITREAMMKKNRNRSIVEARHIVFSILRKNTILSLKTIGDYFYKDHASVLHGCRVVNNLLETDRVFRHNYNEIEKAFMLKFKSSFRNEKDLCQNTKIVYQDVLGCTTPSMDAVCLMFLGTTKKFIPTPNPATEFGR